MIRTRRGRFSDHATVADLLIRHTPLRFRVVSDSMAPTLRPGQLVRLEAVSIDQLAAGDLVVVHAAGALVCHRLMRSYTDEHGARWLVTKSDRSDSEDCPASASCLVGRVAAVCEPPRWDYYLWRFRASMLRWMASHRRT